MNCADHPIKGSRVDFLIVIGESFPSYVIYTHYSIYVNIYKYIYIIISMGLVTRGLGVGLTRVYRARVQFEWVLGNIITRLIRFKRDFNHSHTHNVRAGSGLGPTQEHLFMNCI